MTVVGQNVHGCFAPGLCLNELLKWQQKGHMLAAKMQICSCMYGKNLSINKCLYLTADGLANLSICDFYIQSTLVISNFTGLDENV